MGLDYMPLQDTTSFVCSIKRATFSLNKAQMKVYVQRFYSFFPLKTVENQSQLYKNIPGKSK